MGAKLDLSI